MPKFQSEKLLDSLAADVRRLLLQTESIKALGNEHLRRKPSREGWPIAEVIAHLNYYARFYVQAIENQMEGHQTTSRPGFNPGWFGNYFTRIIGPSPDGQVRNKMKTFKDAEPTAASDLDPEAEIREFIVHQHHLLNLLKIARTADLGRIRVPITLTRLIRLKLGDTFRFVIAHEQRHFQQIYRVMAALNLKVEDSWKSV